MNRKVLMALLGVLCTSSMILPQVASPTSIDVADESVVDEKTSVTSAVPTSGDDFYSLGVRHEAGERLTLALTYYSLAADKGHEKAQYKMKCFELLGTFRLERILCIVDKLTRSALQGNVFAQCYLAYCYEEGVGVVQNWETALHFYAEAARKDCPRALFALGHYSEHGLGGLEQDMQLAMAYYDRSAKLGYKSALDRLAVLKSPSPEPFAIVDEDETSPVSA